MPYFKIGMIYFGIQQLPTKGHCEMIIVKLFKCLRSLLPNDSPKQSTCHFVKVLKKGASSYLIKWSVKWSVAGGETNNILF
jgi:hypothetical protein